MTSGTAYALVQGAEGPLSTELTVDDDSTAEILRRAGVMLSGRPVVLWESDADGQLRPVASDLGVEAVDSPPEDLAAALRRWRRGREGPGRWVTTRVSSGRWCAASVRHRLWRPPPGGERRSRDRMILELAGLCLGLMENGKNGHRAIGPRGRPDRRRSALARIVEQLPAALWTTDTELNITSRAGALDTLVLLSAESASLLELRRQEVVSIETIEAHRRAMAGESLHYHVRRDDRWFDAHVEPLRGDEDRIVGVVGLAIDVSDRERAVEASRLAQQELEDFLDNAPVGVHWAGPDGTVLRVNQAELDMLGYTRWEYIGRNVGDFYVDRALAENCLTRLRAGETLTNVEVTLRHKDGSLRYGLLNSNVRFEGGEFIHTRCVTRDITERHVAEEARARLSAIVESTDDAILAKTLDGTITDWNLAAQKLYGYEPDEIVGRSVAKLIPPGLDNELDGIMERLRHGERVPRYETTRRKKDGSLVKVWVTVSPVLDRSGRPIGASSIARPVPTAA